MLNTKLVCSNCKADFWHPKCGTYEYEDVSRIYTRLPETEVGYCNDCKSFVCIQKGIKNKDIVEKLKKADHNERKYYEALLKILQGRDSVDSCVKCGSTNVVYREDCVCPICQEGKISIEREEMLSDVFIRYGTDYIQPTLAEPKQIEEDIKKNVKTSCTSNDKKVNSTRTIWKDVLKWIILVPSIIVIYIASYWISKILNSIFNVYNISGASIEFLSSLTCTFVAVFAGSLIAPKGRKIVSVVAATFFCLMTILSLILYFQGNSEENNVIVSAIGTIIGAILGSVQVHNKDD